MISLRTAKLPAAYKLQERGRGQAYPHVAVLYNRRKDLQGADTKKLEKKPVIIIVRTTIMPASTQPRWAPPQKSSHTKTMSDTANCSVDS